MTYHHNLSMPLKPTLSKQVFQTQSSWKEFLADQAAYQQHICRCLHSCFQKVPSSFVLYLIFCFIHYCLYFLEQLFCYSCASPSLPRFLPKTHLLLVYPHWPNSTNQPQSLNFPMLFLGQTQPFITPCLGRGDKTISTNFQFIITTHYLPILQGK